jgi:hypothetical protein
VARSLHAMSDVGSDPFLDNIRVTSELARKFPGKHGATKPSKQTNSERFRFYKISVDIAKNALAICHKSVAPISILLALYEIHFRDFGSNPVRLTSKILNRYRISRYRKYRALKLLEIAGLIRVERVKNRNPLVTLKWLPVKRENL